MLYPEDLPSSDMFIATDLLQFMFLGQCMLVK